MVIELLACTVVGGVIGYVGYIGRIMYLEYI